jgi:hypothetical protein
VSERERVARIVDPEAWNPEVQVWTRDVRQADALLKADAILSRPEPSEAVVGERTFSDWYEEMEGYALRLERAVHDLGPKAEAWLRAAYDQGKADASKDTP